jgi:pimeloyl-ACP methyl ester carboxylesterase
MKKLIITIATTLLLAACGGNSDPLPAAPIAQCNGTPRTAVVYAGSEPFPELASVGNACVYSTQDTSVEALVTLMQQARTAAGVTRPFLVGSGAGADLALAYMAGDPGRTDGASLWLGQFDPATKLGGSIVTYKLNGPNCEPLASALRASWTPAFCSPADRFDGARAIEQLQLQIVR